MKYVLTLVLALASAPALAKEPIFVAPEQSRMTEFLPAPPADSKADLQELHEVEAKRSDAEIKQAQFDSENENLNAFADALGDKFILAALPLTAAFSQHIVNDASVNVRPVKAFFHRLRPYQIDPTIQPVCKGKSLDDSYPSGHASVGYLLALALVEMVPEKRDVVMARAEAFAHSRLVCGVHFESDVQASRWLAYAVHALMTQNPQYRVELAAARSELRAALGLP